MRPRQFINQQCSTSKSDSFRVALVLLLLTAAQLVHAQISGDATLVSDYRYRGVSLSQGGPEAQLSVGYDHPDGWYAGGLLSGAKLNDHDTQQLVGYAGYSGQLWSGLSWESGVSSTSFLQTSDYNYKEVFIGATSENYSARIYYSPSYFDLYTRSIYAEFNAVYLLQDKLQLLAHAGVLHSNTGNNESPSSSRFDCRIGINAKFVDWDVQLAWVALQKKSTEYPQYEDRHPHIFLLSASYSF
jgi:uncharacterized protein (TIGR02001 family)